jgi:hypothetical protein
MPPSDPRIAQLEAALGKYEYAYMMFMHDNDTDEDWEKAHLAAVEALSSSE